MLWNIFLQNDVYNRGWYWWISYHGKQREIQERNAPSDRHNKNSAVCFPLGFCPALSLCGKQDESRGLRWAPYCTWSNWKSNLELLMQLTNNFNPQMFWVLMTYAWQVFSQSYCLLPRNCSDTKYQRSQNVNKSMYNQS